MSTGDPYYCFEHKVFFCMAPLHWGIWDNTAIAYAAGFFDGEGCVSIVKDKTKTGNPSYRVRAYVKQVDPAPLYKLQYAYRGLVTETKRSDKNPKHRNTYNWEVHSGRAVTFLITIRPYLIVKADEVDLALEFANIVSTQFRGIKKPPETIALCEDYKARLSAMKRRTYAPAEF